jgi:hypothetical protein
MWHRYRSQLGTRVVRPHMTVCEPFGLRGNGRVSAVHTPAPSPQVNQRIR